jgi:hypothetical protein
MEREACQFHRRAGGGHFRRKTTHDRYDFDGRNAACPVRSKPYR